MDLTSSSTHNTLDAAAITQTTPTQPTKSQPFTNGTHKPHPTTTPPPPQPPSMVVFSYKECLKNHAASIGGHALDGCGEFMPSSSTNPSDPRSLKCAACGCHRNFHRRDPQQEHNNNNKNPTFLSCIYNTTPSATVTAPPLLLPLPHRAISQSTSPSLTSSPSQSPSPISSPSPPPLSHFPPSSAPHMLLALGTNSYPPTSTPSHDHDQMLLLQHQHHHKNNNDHLNNPIMSGNNNSSKKRYRTKFSKEQKEKMQSFSEKLGWRMQKGDDGLVQKFCNEIGVTRGVFKVWMHNNKNKRSEALGIGIAPTHQTAEKTNGDHDYDGNDHGNGNGNGGGFHSDINNPYNPNSSSNNNNNNNDIHMNEEDSCNVNVNHVSIN